MARIAAGGVQAVVSIPNQPTFRAEVVTVSTTGTPVQLPAIAVPDTVTLAVRAKATNGVKRIFVANSAANVADPTKRAELRAGEGLELAITDASLVWIDASANGAQVEVIVEA